LAADVRRLTGFAGAVQYRLWRVVTAVVGRIPPRASYRVAFVVGSAAYYAWPRARRSMHHNYRRVLRGAPASEVRRVARRSLINYCCYLADFVRFPSLSAERLAQSVVGGEASFKALDLALERGKGAVIVCMHFGNWDLGAGAAAARGYPLTVVAETFSDPRLDAMVVGSRTRLGMQIVKMEKAGPSLVRALKQNGLLALLIDRPVPGDGVKVQFFGEEVEVPAGPARLALLTGAMVVPAAFARVAPNELKVTTLADFGIDSHANGDQPHDVNTLTQAIMEAHERFIRQYPDQWYMFREMWPHKRGVPCETR
jgi:lauroyl/myristoyl acyltransferase